MIYGCKNFEWRNIMSSALDTESQRLLAFTVNTRESIVKELMKDGKAPEDTGGRILLMQALDGIDRTVIGKAKIKVDENNSKNQQQMTSMVAKLLTSVTTPRSTEPRRPAVLDAEFIVRDKVEGESDIGVQSLTYKQFFKDEE
jgi:hypothetical protein